MAYTTLNKMVTVFINNILIMICVLCYILQKCSERE